MILNEQVPCRLPPLGWLAPGLLAALALPAWLEAAPAPRALERDVGLAAVLAQAVAGDSQNVVDADALDAGVEDDGDEDDGIDEEVERRIEEALGPDFEKRMEALGERIATAMEATFGPGSEFEKAMQSLGNDLEETFGEDFAGRMEAFGARMEAKFGPEFERRVKAIGAAEGDGDGGQRARNGVRPRLSEEDGGRRQGNRDESWDRH